MKSPSESICPASLSNDDKATVLDFRSSTASDPLRGSHSSRPPGRRFRRRPTGSGLATTGRSPPRTINNNARFVFSRRPWTPTLSTPSAVRIRALVNAAGDREIDEDRLTASLVVSMRREPENPHDVNAVAIATSPGPVSCGSPHDMRHAYAEHIARKADTRVAQHLLGHAHLGTTETYLGRPRLDDMVAAVKNSTYGIRTNVLGSRKTSRSGSRRRPESNRCSRPLGLMQGFRCLRFGGRGGYRSAGSSPGRTCVHRSGGERGA
jgi:hypothetical protein